MNKPDLEQDLLSSDYIKQKCKNSEVYSQNLYSAICNNLFYKNTKNGVAVGVVLVV